MAKKKLKKFAELNTFSNVIQTSSPLHHEGFPLLGQWANAFFRNNAPVVLEVGCGRGEYTLALAKKYPEQNFIGIDIKGDRMWTGAKQALEEGLFNVAFLRIQAQHINAYFEPGEVDGIWLTFPDPQLRESRKNKRLTSPDFLRRYSMLLKPDSPIHLKTDNARLYRYTLDIIEKEGHTLIHATDNLYQDAGIDEELVKNVQTRYEEMFREKDQPIHYLKWSLQPKPSTR